MPRLLPLVLLLALTALPAIARAQLVRVHAVEEVNARPAAGAILELVDSAGGIAAQVILSAEGRRDIILTRGGVFRPRVRRIGYPPWTGEAITVGAAPVDVQLVVPARRISLAPVEVRASRCAGDAFTEPAFAALWDEVHKALTSTSLGNADSLTILETRTFLRTIGRDGRVQGITVGLPRTTAALKPYVALPAAELARDGYVQLSVADSMLVFNGPDEDVLRSPEFIGSHCFGIVRGDRENAGLFGVRFTPTAPRARRALNDIAGTLWIDSASAELRYVDFHFESALLPATARGADRSGGRVVFRRLPSGRWIVGAWHLRMPRIAGTPLLRRVEGFQEFGGVVTPTEDDAATVNRALGGYLPLLARGAVDGTVFDSLAMRPIGGARVWLVPIEPDALHAVGLAGAGDLNVLPTSAIADSLGRWAFRDVAGGAYRIGFEHPAIDTLGLPQRRPELRLEPGGRAAVPLWIPSVAALTRDCERDDAASRSALLLGFVRSWDDAPVAEAAVQATWGDPTGNTEGGRAEGQVAPDGSFRICGVATGSVARVTAVAGADTARAAAGMPWTGFARVHLRMPSPDSARLPAAGGDDGASLARIAAADSVALRAGAYWRFRSGHARTLSGAALERGASLRELLDALPGTRTQTGRVRGPWVVVLERAGVECRARLFVDGAEADYADIQRIDPRTLLAVEVIRDPAFAPVWTTGAPIVGRAGGCGVVLLWSRGS